jgi:phosphatidylglycerol:prolipoprotein diacylglycerol transferase
MGIVVPWVRALAFEVAGFKIYWYGLCLGCAFLAPYYMLEREMERKKIKVDAAHFVIAAVVGGLVGSRALFLMSYENMVSLGSLKKAVFSSTGYSFQGGLILAVAMCMLLMYRNRDKMAFIEACDIMANLVTLGYVFGKVGCFTSGDGCYGTPTDMPWGMAFPNALSPTKPGVFVHPTPLYEIALNLALFLYLFQRRDRDPMHAQSHDWLVLFGLARFVNEFWRKNDTKEELGGLTQYQLIALGISLCGWVWRVLAKAGALTVCEKRYPKKDAKNGASTGKVKGN